MNKDRAKPRELNPSVKQLIYYRAITQRKMPRGYLARELIREIENAGEVAPTEETAKKYISKARGSDNPLDKPWSIASCSDYSSFFTPESVVTIMDCKKWAKDLFKDANEEYSNLFGVSISDISVRHAMWIVRLKPLIEKTFADLMDKDDNIRFGYPFFIAMFYAISETTCEILGETFSSIHLDNALASRNLKRLSLIGRFDLMASSKPIQCDHNCESCEYMRLPGLSRFCIPRRKENKK